MKKSRSSFLVTLVLACALFLGGASQSMTVYAQGDDTEDVRDEEIAEEVENANLPTAEELAAAEKEKEKLTYQQQIDAINAQLEQNKAEEDRIKQNLSAVRGEKEEKQAVVNSIGAQISNTQYEISLMEDKIYLLEMDIQDKEQRITEKMEEYKKNYETFLGRFRTMNMHNNASVLGLILGTDSYVDFLTTTDTVNRIAEHDKLLMEELERERLELEKEKESLETSQTDLDSTRAITEVKKQELAGQQAIAIDEVQSVQQLQSQFEAELAESQRKSAEMQAQIDAIYAKLQTSEEPYVGGVMQWPVSGHYTVSSQYGWRFGGSDFHTGMDITGGNCLGAPVIAANGGTVVSTNWSHTPGYGYGIFVILDHGGGTTTLYAHLSNISVQNGQQVSKGQQIGAVGSTGWSTGPHLHFEVRLNGGHVNPQPYVTG